MNDSLAGRPALPGKYSFSRAVVVLTGTVLLFALLLTPLAVWHGGTAVGQLFAAVGVCLVPALLALAAVELLAEMQQPVAAVLLPIFLRIAPPLATCLYVAMQGGARAYLPYIFSLVTLYVVTLGVETYLSVRITQARQT